MLNICNKTFVDLSDAWCISVSCLYDYQTKWVPCGRYPLTYRCVGHDGKGDIVLKAFWEDESG